jgi:hypothetical protein
MKNKKSPQIFFIGLTVLGLSLIWKFLAPHIDTKSPEAQPVGLEWRHRMEALKRYKQNSNDNTYEYETDSLPVPLLGGPPIDNLKK